MDDQANAPTVNMALTEIPGTSLKVSPVAIGTWAIGGWMWGGTDEAESIGTIRAAFEHGINLVDTAPVYGFGRSEEIVGRAIAEAGLRADVLIATKAGLQWEGGSGYYQVQRRRIGSDGHWHKIGRPTAATAKCVVGRPIFDYRVVSLTPK